MNIKQATLCWSPETKHVMVLEHPSAVLAERLGLTHSTGAGDHDWNEMTKNEMTKYMLNFMVILYEEYGIPMHNTFKELQKADEILEFFMIAACSRSGI